MSLSPFDSFQTRFVTYLLNFPRRTTTVLYSMCFLSVIYIYMSANAVMKLQIIFCNPITQIALLCVTITVLCPFKYPLSFYCHSTAIAARQSHSW